MHLGKGPPEVWMQLCLATKYHLSGKKVNLLKIKLNEYMVIGWYIQKINI